MTQPDPSRTREDPLAIEEWRGTSLALLGKAVIVAVMTIYVFFNFSAPGIYWPLMFSAIFTATCVLQWWLNKYRPNWFWLRTVIIAMDAVALVIVISSPNPFSGFDMSDQTPFRGAYFILLLLYIISVGYSYRPMVAVVAGVSSAVAWATKSYIIGARPESVSWSSLPEGATSEDVMAIFGNPYFFDVGARFAEIIALILGALLIAGLVARSRAQVLRVLASERRRRQAIERQQFISDTFGKYVPDAVARQIIEDRGQLVPQAREATVLFADLAGFTSLGERVSPETLLRILNAYFDAAGQIITKHGGTINQFQGDAILASFNVPVADERHATQAVQAAKALADMVAEEVFEGERLGVRIGLNTGELAAGAVGGADRLSYTVHGTCVNVAARLEQMNKEVGTTILIAEGTARQQSSDWRLREVGALEIRGVGEPVMVFTVAEDGT